MSDILIEAMVERIINDIVLDGMGVRQALAEAYTVGYNNGNQDVTASMVDLPSALEAARTEGYNRATQEVQSLQDQLHEAQTALEDYKRIHETEKIGERLETYTEGYRQRAEALMDAQARALQYDLLKKQYDTTVHAAQDNYAQVQALKENVDRAERNAAHWKKEYETAYAKIAELEDEQMYRELVGYYDGDDLPPEFYMMRDNRDDWIGFANELINVLVGLGVDYKMCMLPNAQRIVRDRPRVYRV